MSKARLQMALRYVRFGEQLVAGQRLRMAYLERVGQTRSLANAMRLQSILEDSLKAHRRHLEELRRYYQTLTSLAETRARFARNTAFATAGFCVDASWRLRTSRDSRRLW